MWGPIGWLNIPSVFMIICLNREILRRNHNWMKRTWVWYIIRKEFFHRYFRSLDYPCFRDEEVSCILISVWCMIEMGFWGNPMIARVSSLWLYKSFFNDDFQILIAIFLFFCASIATILNMRRLCMWNGGIVNQCWENLLLWIPS